ncbi:Hypothetical protein A7982_05740 [Minicystis rosea]|nr:Hypothetical protein A7982_05740 [Minicystis rosea]
MGTSPVERLRLVAAHAAARGRSHSATVPPFFRCARESL